MILRALGRQKLLQYPLNAFGRRLQQAVVQCREAFRDARLLSRRLQLRQRSIGQGWWRERVLQQFRHDKILTQNIGQTHPRLQALAPYQLPIEPIHAVGNDMGAFE